MELRYCLECGRIVPVIVDNEELEFHTKLVYLGVDMPEVDLCDGPFATSTPPENFESDWDIDLVEPDGDEMFIINHNAEQLLADFE